MASAQTSVTPPWPFVALTIDVEEWFHAHALQVPRTDWPTIPSRVDAPINLILEQLYRRQARATFFVLGYVAKSRPDIVKRIAVAGHEIASHGQDHRRADEQSIAEFRDDIATSKNVLEDLIGCEVLGYRAPSYSLTSQMTVYFETLAEVGYVYDSSIYPAAALHRNYGDPTANTTPHYIHPAIYEFPLPTLKLGPRRFPAATGAYLRLVPYSVTRWAINQNLRRGIPVVINVHPWEFDPDQPRINVPLTTRFRHYAGQRSMKNKLSRLLETYGSVPLVDMLPDGWVARSSSGLAVVDSIDLVAREVHLESVCAGHSISRHQEPVS